MLKQKKNSESQKENKTQKMSLSKLEQFIADLKSQNIILKQEGTRLKDKLIRDKQQNQKQMRILKQKIASLNEKQITSYLFKPQNSSAPSYESQYKKIKIELSIASDSLEEEKKRTTVMERQMDRLKRQIQCIEAEKDAHLQFSILEKIQLQDRCNLLEKEIESKKMIIQSLGSRNAKVSQLQANLINQERKIVQRGKQMQKYEKQFSDHFKNNEEIYKQKLRKSEKENEFLKQRIEKILKNVKHKCKCADENSQWKNKLYNVGRQLVKTKVQLSRYTQSNQKRQPKQQSSSSENQSIDSLKLSYDSDDSNGKKINKNK